EVDVRYIAHRQQPVGHDAEEQDADHDEGRHDGTLDEQIGDVHGRFSVAGPPAAGFSSTLAPGTSRICPSVTTFSPGCTPLSITDSCPRVRPTTTGRDSTVESGRTTKTN